MSSLRGTKTVPRVVAAATPHPHSSEVTMRALPLRRTGRHAAALAVTVGMLGSGFLMYQSSQAAFSDTTSNAANRFAAGKVVLGNSSNGTAMFSQAANGYLKPGQSGFFCIQVDYTGNVA